MNKYYNIRGKVYGKCWGGGEGAYKMTEFKNINNVEDWKNEYINKLGELDAGMGYEEVLGAILEIEEVLTIKKGGKIFKNSEYITDFIGKLTEDQKMFLEEILYLIT